MSTTELQMKYGSLLFQTEAVGGIIWVFRERGFYPATTKGEYIAT